MKQSKEFLLPLYLIAAIADRGRRRRCLAFSSQNLVSAFNEAEAHRGLLQPSTLRAVGEGRDRNVKISGAEEEKIRKKENSNYLHWECVSGKKDPENGSFHDESVKVQPER